MTNEQAIDLLLTISEASQEAATVGLLIDRIRHVLSKQWFRSEEEDMKELVEAIENRNSEKAVEIIEEKENSEEIFQTIEQIYRNSEGQKELSQYNG